MIDGRGFGPCLARAFRSLTSTFKDKTADLVYVGHDFMEKAMGNAVIACGAAGPAGAQPDTCPRVTLRRAMTKAAKARRKQQAHRRSTRGFLPKDTTIQHWDQLLDQLKVPRKQREQMKQQVLCRLRGLEHLQQFETRMQQVLHRTADMQQDSTEGRLPPQAATVTATLVAMGEMLQQQQDQAAASEQQQAELQQQVQQLLQQHADLQAQVASKDAMIKQQQRQQAAMQLVLAREATAVEQLEKQREQLKQQLKHQGARQKLRGQAIEVDLRNMQVTIKSLRIRCSWLRCALFPAMTLHMQQLVAERRSALAAKDAAIADQAAAKQRMVADRDAQLQRVAAAYSAHLKQVERDNKNLAAQLESADLQRQNEQQQSQAELQFTQQQLDRKAALLADKEEAIQHMTVEYHAHINAATEANQAMKAEHNAVIEDMKEIHAAELECMAEDHASDMNLQCSRHKEKVQQMAEERDAYREQVQVQLADLAAKVERANQQRQQQKQATKCELALKESELSKLRARINALEYGAGCGQEAACGEGCTQDEQACGEGYGQHEVECGAGYPQDEEDSFQQGATEGHWDASQHYAATGEPAYSWYAAAHNPQYAMPTVEYSMQYGGQYGMYNPQAMDSSQCVNQQGSQAEQGGVPASYYSWPYLVPYYDQYGNPQGWGPYMPSCTYLPQYAAAGSGSDGAAGEPEPLQQVYEGGEGGDDGVKHVDNSGSAPVYCFAA